MPQFTACYSQSAGLVNTTLLKAELYRTVNSASLTASNDNVSMVFVGLSTTKSCNQIVDKLTWYKTNQIYRIK
jgi:hypothetical protein